MAKVKVAVIMFPGTNCEVETKEAAEVVGMQANILRWNSNYDDLEKYDCYIIPGGWSYEDRIRSGAISAKDPIMEKIKEESMKGKVVLGICNGAQVLVECGMVPGLKFGKLEMALAPNINPKISGFYCKWVTIKLSTKKKTAFNYAMDKDELIRLPIAHAEGRFTSSDEALIQTLEDNDQIMFKYCDELGNVIDNYPVNPNGSVHSAAAICNKEGNVMSIMPHPERATWNRQLPYYENHEFKDAEAATPARKIFESIKKYIEENKKW